MMLFPLSKKQSSQKSNSSFNKLELATFKLVECHIKTYHDHKQCQFYHSQKDRRRDLNRLEYQPDLCSYHSAG